MKEQYVGDVSDYRKYALLRALSAGGPIRIGVCWMLTPPDDRPDGRKIGYLSEPAKWRRFDPPLFDLLCQVVDAPDLRRLHLIEKSGIVPGAMYQNAVVPDELEGRRTYMADALRSLASADLIFFDPDNGLEVPSKPKGRKNSSKYVFHDEIEAAYSAGHSLLIYQHFPMAEPWELFVRRLAAGLRRITPGSHVWALETSHVVFFLVLQPKHQEALLPDVIIPAEQRDKKLLRKVHRLSDA